MCGITGIFFLNDHHYSVEKQINESLNLLSKRGPNNKAFYLHPSGAIGHTRLSIIDTSIGANQPMHDLSGRYSIVFNGEIFNYKSLAEELIQSGVKFQTKSDTEVLLQLWIKYKTECIQKLNGFFAFAIYDKLENSLTIVRDRFGEKPLLYYKDDTRFIFGSEIKALLAYEIKKEIDFVSLFHYLQFNYIPAPNSIFKNIWKVMPGHYLQIKGNDITEHIYYKTIINENSLVNSTTSTLVGLVESSVKNRLESDVPLGTFLSGGIDSSIVTGIASNYIKDLPTFSIGFPEQPFYDETKFANIASSHFKTNHTVFEYRSSDLEKDIFDLLDYLDEPFADSSAIPMFLLCKNTSNSIKVALSGDGADEIFGGYNKHQAEYRLRHPSAIEKTFSKTSILLNYLPASRETFWGNKIRQLQKFTDGFGLNPEERYWQWCSFNSINNITNLLSEKSKNQLSNHQLNRRKQDILSNFGTQNDFNDVLLSDMNMVLQNDMLVKVDQTSMANSLEVRSPFLDYRIVDFAFSLPDYAKTTRNERKKILIDSFKDFLPNELLNRPKHGFEVPLKPLFTGIFSSFIQKNLLNKSFIENQGIFEFDSVQKVVEKSLSSNPNDAIYTVWNLIIFQHWWQKYYN